MTPEPRPRPAAVAIGKALEADPPAGYADRYSAIGWAHIAEAVLRAQERLS